MELIINNHSEKKIYIQDFSRNFMINNYERPIHFILILDDTLETSINNLLFFEDQIITHISITNNDEIIYDFDIQNGRFYSIEDKISNVQHLRSVIASLKIEAMTVGKI